MDYGDGARSTITCWLFNARTRLRGRGPVCLFSSPALFTDEDGDAEFMRAVVIITAETEKGTVRHPQEYSNPLLTLDGKQYASMTFDELHNRICDTLRGNRPRLILETLSPDGLHSLHFEDGTPRNS